MRDGKVTVKMPGDRRELWPDSLDVAKVGRLSLFVIKRSDKYGIRLKDPDSQYRREFHGIEYYPAKEEYKVTARFVADPKKLKAEIKIPETQAKDVTIGQKATVDTRNGVVEGLVSRIDPSVQNGTVTVDVRITDPLPHGARPDLSVDGTVELENLKDVLFVGRPVNGQSDSTIGIFKLVDDGAEAVRVSVKLGRSSVNTIEIRDGLKVGDKVILSDMSRYDNVERVRLK